MPRLRTRTQLTTSTESPPPLATARPRRGASGTNRQQEEGSTITVARDPSSSPADARQSIRLTMKMPSSKLREATTRGAKSVIERESFSPADVVPGVRSTRAKKPVIVDSESDEEDEEEAEDDDEADAEGEEDEDAEGDEDIDAEGEDDAEGEIDVEMADAPPPKVTITQARDTTSGRRGAPAKAPTKADVKSAKPSGRIMAVEEKEMQMTDAGDSDEEELSDLSDDMEEGEEDAEGDDADDDEDMGEDGDEEDAEGDSDDEGTPGGTPDPMKQTKRQRTRLDQDFLQLPMEPQIKKHLTAEEHAMRRAEMARRRKNLSEKRNEEEKMETINRLLKKQAPKRRGKISAAEIAAGADTPDVELEKEPEHVDPVFSRWISKPNGGFVLGLPSEWKDTPVGAFAGSKGWKMVEEVEG